MLIALGILLFVLLVVVHEYGHFLVAKRNGVEVEEFGIGFPPKIAGKKMGKGIFRCYYSVNLIPLGGFVRLKGEHDADKSPGAYGSVRLPAKLRIMLAGVTMNLIVALIMFTAVAWLGMPQMIENQFSVSSDTKSSGQQAILSYVEPGSPAERAGLKAGDRIDSIGDRKITSEQELKQATKFYAGQIVQVTSSRSSEQREVRASLLTQEEVLASQNSDNPKGYLGVISSDYKLTRATWSAPIQAIGVSGQFTALTLKAIGTSLLNLGKALAHLLTGSGSEARQRASEAGQNIAGPVGVFAIFKQGSSLGYQFILFLIALISLTLAIMNFLPIPALDGGKAFVTLLFRAIKKPLTERTEDLIHGTGFALLMLLFVVITIVDVGRFF